MFGLVLPIFSCFGITHRTLNHKNCLSFLFTADLFLQFEEESTEEEPSEERTLVK